MPDAKYSLCLIAVVAAVTAGIRFLPFVLFKKSVPESVMYLASLLPPAVMGMLIVYCLRSISFLEGTRGIPELICVAVVALLQKWRHNTLLSILGGTLLYMLFMQVF